MSKRLAGLVAIAAVALATPANAAWNVAKSKHFIIYADDNPKRLQEFASELERFDSAVRFAIRMDDPQIGDGNRLTVFMLPTVKDVRALVGDTSGFIAGFYTGRVTGSLAYVPKGSDNSDLGDGAIFFHEYTHHLMQQDLDRPYPQWYSEGFAEFFSTPKFERDGSVLLGRIVAGRAYGLLQGPQLPLETLFSGIQPNMTKEQRDVFYGRGWLLTHYLQLEDRRKGQLQTYLDAMYKGASSMDAAHQAFGDLAQLDKELKGYLTKPLMQLKIPASAIHDQPVTVTPLSEGSAQVVLSLAKIDYESKPEGAEAAAAQVRGVEARFPGDELVETTLAKAELEAGHAEAAEAAADRAIKTNPKNTEALVLKGKSIAIRASGIHDESRHSQFEEARAALIAANKLDTEDPEPLFEYYRSYLREGIRPTANALAALHYASDLAPQDLGVRMSSAVAYLNEGKPQDARAALTVVAYSPHGERLSDVARRMIAQIDSGTPRAALLEMRSGPKPQEANSN
jgi:tetratricopeptide (TPR) repeat protein